MQKICSVKIGMDAKITLDRIRENLAKKGLNMTNQRIMELSLEYTGEHLDELKDYIMSEGEELKKMLANPKRWGVSTASEKN